MGSMGNCCISVARALCQIAIFLDATSPCCRPLSVLSLAIPAFPRHKTQKNIQTANMRLSLVFVILGALTLLSSRAWAQDINGLTLVKKASKALLAKQAKVLAGNGKDAISDAGNTDPVSQTCVFEELTNSGYYLGPANKKQGIQKEECREGESKRADLQCSSFLAGPSLPVTTPDTLPNVPCADPSPIPIPPRCRDSPISCTSSRKAVAASVAAT